MRFLPHQHAVVMRHGEARPAVCLAADRAECLDASAGAAVAFQRFGTGLKAVSKDIHHWSCNVCNERLVR